VSQSAGPVTVRVPAKINVHLAVGPRRSDGFHELSTVFHAVDLYDTVTASPASGLSLQLSGPTAAGLPADAANLAWRAAALLAEHAGVPADAALQVDKAIPVAAGLAGGSADAAAALRACARLWHLDVSDAALAGLAARLGSDVTFALHGRTALGTGRGELLQPEPVAAELHWVIAAARGELSTPAVYAELDRQRDAGTAGSTVGDPAAVIEALRLGDVTSLGTLLGNDLQPAALELAPYLHDTLRTGEQAGALGGIVSGSGPSCVFLAADAPAAERIVAGLAETGTCRFALAVRGNVAGAEIMADL
jgi:4-diphosphocytidyl-2-C-methyl-D-erythritol kinase